MALQWENIRSTAERKLSLSVRRARVPGGWLVFIVESWGSGTTGGFTFYPDPEHTWTP